MIMNNLITTAVKENKPELITNHPSFDVDRIQEEGDCVVGDMFSLKECDGISCDQCPLYIEYGRATIQSTKQWLKLEPVVQPITYSEEEVKELFISFQAYNMTEEDMTFMKVENWFENNKKK